MNTVELPRDEALSLLTEKLRNIDLRMQQILERWNQPSAEVFLEKTRIGELEDAEMDAIILTNLIEEHDRLNTLYARFEE